MAAELPIDQIIQGDTLTVLPTLPAKSVDLVFADPPYNLQLNKELWRPNFTQVDAVDDEWDQFEDFAAYDAFTREWLSAARRVMKDNATIWVSGTYHNIFRVGAIMQDLGYWILNTVTWFKTNAMPNFNGTRLKNDVEFVIWAKKSEKSRYTFHHHLVKTFNDFSPGKQLGSVWKINACGGEERLKGTDGRKLHSTQKPEELLMRIVAASSSPGDMVLDPFIGTGTTAVVAKRLHRRWIGIERESVYVEAARKRITETQLMLATDPLVGAALEDKPKRVPFKDLIKFGYLHVGDQLYLDKPEQAAAILENGDLFVNGSTNITGSIHHVGKTLKGAPSCNGWMHWYYEDKNSGERRAIDALRQEVRAKRGP